VIARKALGEAVRSSGEARSPMAALEEARGRANEAGCLADLLETGADLARSELVEGDEACLGEDGLA